MATPKSSTDVTPESIEREKQVQQEARAEVERKTGIRIADEPPPPKKAAPYIVHCPVAMCQHKAVSRREMQAINSLSAHVVRAHMEAK